MRLVVDASVVVAALVDDGPTGRWALAELMSAQLVAPHLMPVEVMHALRRAVMAHDLSPEVAAPALGDLADLPVALFAFGPFADRGWELRATVTPHDAWYVGLAEALDVPFVTLDGRLAAAPGPHCTFRTPPD